MVIFLIIFFIFFLSIVIGSEFTAYLWHRYGAHTDILPKVYDTHKIHHIAELTHEAHEDFYYIIIILLLAFILLYFFWYSGYMKFIGLHVIYPVLAYLIVFTVFVWNWYIHSAYHVSDHWLNQYEWFKKDKRIHLQHHINPSVNYGIASHFNDIVFGTYEYPVNNQEEIFNK